MAEEGETQPGVFSLSEGDVHRLHNLRLTEDAGNLARLLRETFPDHQIVPKLPLTRFTMPRDPEQGREWFEMLSTAYCSFTICSPDGQVIGCVDVTARAA